jgi:hypothetical protein
MFGMLRTLFLLVLCFRYKSTKQINIHEHAEHTYVLINRTFFLKYGPNMVLDSDMTVSTSGSFSYTEKAVLYTSLVSVYMQ